MRILFLLPLALCACQTLGLPRGEDMFDVPEGEVRVTRATADAARVTLRLSDGTRCSAERPEGVTGNWSGVTTDCGYALPFTVAYKPAPRPERFTIEAPLGGSGPRAEVYVTDVDGVRRLFVAPLGDDVRFETTPPAPV
ncbi:hypothetical protein [uncultured Jannaschia sp.]|uniref:hypothetical protein n=1 Tax=uncultured Jannaschia sp. TaxID=293347 RepID=UPI00261ADDF0|nr:hypothetical protein [uncultured Jannaschia sp.]